MLRCPLLLAALSPLAAAQAPYLHRVDTPGGVVEVGNYASFPSISSDGEHVVYYKRVPEAVPGGGVIGKDRDVWAHDLRTGTFELVSVDPLGQRMVTLADFEPLYRGADLSDDGRFVVFTALSDTPMLGDTDGWNDVYLRDLELGTTEWISQVDAVPTGGVRHNYPVISGDGRWVAYQSSSQGWVSGPSQLDSVTLVDRQAGTTTVIYTPKSTSFENVQQGLALSSDGSTVAWVGRTNETDVALMTYATATGITTVHPEVSAAGYLANSAPYFHVSLDAAGQRVAFTSSIALTPDDTNNYRDVYVFDRTTHGLQLVSGCYLDGDDSESQRPSLSGNGRYVAFESRSKCLNGTSKNVLHVHVADLSTGLITVQSMSDLGALGDAQAGNKLATTSGARALSHDGELVVFESNYENLATPTVGTLIEDRGVFLRERQVDGPDLSIDNLVAGGIATLRIEGATPGGALLAGYSFAGQGPLPSYWGLIDLGLPFTTFPLVADAAGDVAHPLAVPAALAGERVWVKALDLAGSAPSTTFMGVVE